LKVSPGGAKESPVATGIPGLFCRPAGAALATSGLHPRLTPWATLLRPSGPGRRCKDHSHSTKVLILTPMPPVPRPLGGEAVKKFRNERNHLAQRRGGAEAKKRIRQLLILYLCASASLREMVDFFTASERVARRGVFISRGEKGAPRSACRGGEGSLPPQQVARSCFPMSAAFRLADAREGA